MEKEENGTCRFPRERLEDYAEGILPEAEAKETEEHLSRCPTCRKTVEETKKLREMLQKAAETVPEDFTEKTMAMIRARKKKEEKQIILRRVTRYATTGIAACLLVTAGIRLTGLADRITTGRTEEAPQENTAASGKTYTQGERQVVPSKEDVQPSPHAQDADPVETFCPEDEAPNDRYTEEADGSGTNGREKPSETLLETDEPDSAEAEGIRFPAAELSGITRIEIQSGYTGAVTETEDPIRIAGVTETLKEIRGYQKQDTRDMSGTRYTVRLYSGAYCTMQFAIGADKEGAYLTYGAYDITQDYQKPDRYEIEAGSYSMLESILSDIENG